MNYNYEFYNNIYVIVQKPNQPYKLYRGTNMEVSMPTGSLCAERNVIGIPHTNYPYIYTYMHE